MKLLQLFLFLSVLVSPAAVRAAASSNCKQVIKKSAYTSQDYAYLKKTLSNLLEMKAYDDAYAICFDALEVLPEKFFPAVHLTLGKLLLHTTDKGMPRNVVWAKFWFDKVTKSAYATIMQQAEALKNLKDLADENSVAIVAPLSDAKPLGRHIVKVQIGSKQIFCPVCSKSFATLRGLHIHQTIKQHKASESFPDSNCYKVSDDE
jgi:hypothetical protein